MIFASPPTRRGSGRGLVIRSGRGSDHPHPAATTSDLPKQSFTLTALLSPPVAKSTAISVAVEGVAYHEPTLKWA